MSGEKIDLRDYKQAAEFCEYPVVSSEVLLALVRAVRAAMKFSNSGHVAHRMALDAALAPFTDSNDSAEVRSDGE